MRLGRAFFRSGLAVLPILSLMTLGVVQCAAAQRTTPIGGSATTRTGARPRTAAPVPPLITGVSAEGLGILVNWQLTTASESMTAATATATPVKPAGVTVPPGCVSRTDRITGTASAAIVTGVCAGVSYEVTMTLTTASGTSRPSAPSAPVVPLAARPPSVPLITSVTPSSGRLVVGWAAPLYDGGSAITGYKLTLAAGKSVLTITTSATARSASVSGLTNGRVYSLALEAVNALGPSLAAKATGKPEAPQVPSAPQVVSALPESTGEVRVTWSPPANDGDDTITSYVVSYQQETAVDSGGQVVYQPTSGVGPVVTTVTGLSHTFSGLATGNAFFVFTVKAVNSVGKSAASAPTSPVSAGSDLATGAVLLSPADLGGISSIQNGAVTWTYASDSAAPAEIQDLAAGQVLVGGSSTKTPDGILRNVITVTNPAPGVYVAATRQAALSDAFTNLAADATFNPLGTAGGSAGQTSGRIRITDLAPGLIELRQSPRAGVSTSFVLAGIFAGGLSGSTAPINGVSASAAGGFSASYIATITPSFEVKPTIERDLLGIPSSASVDVQARLGIDESASASFTGTLGVKLHLLTIDLPTFTVFIGPVPVLITPEMPVYLTGSTSGSIGSDETFNVTYGSGLSWSSSSPTKLRYQNLTTSPTGSFTPQFAPTVGFTSSIGLSFVPDLSFYDATGPEVVVNVGLSVTFTPRAKAGEPWAELDFDLGISAGWDVHLLGWDEQVTAGPPEATIPIVKLYAPIPQALRQPVALTLSPLQSAVLPGKSETFRVGNARGAVTWDLQGAAGDKINSKGQLTVVGPLNRWITVTAKDTNGDSGSAVVFVGQPIGPPTNLKAILTTDGTEAVVTWKPPALPTGTTIASYTVTTQPPTSTVVIKGSAPTSVKLSGLQAETIYVIDVYARTSGGYVSLPASTTVFPPLPAPLDWSAAQIVDANTAGDYLTGISCPTTTFCMAVDSGGDTVIFDGSTWTKPATPAVSGYSRAISCVPGNFCVVGIDGDVVSYDGTWGSPWPVFPSGLVNAVSCTSATFCAAVSNLDQVSLFNGTTWSTATTLPGPSQAAPLTVSCESPTFCSSDGDPGPGQGVSAISWVFDGTTWTESTGDGGGILEAVSCPEVDYCTAVDDVGNAMLGNGGEWDSPIDIDGTTPIDSVSCTGYSWCVATDGVNAFTWNGQGWDGPVKILSKENFSAVSCATVTFCVAVGSEDAVVGR